MMTETLGVRPIFTSLWNDLALRSLKPLRTSLKEKRYQPVILSPFAALRMTSAESSSATYTPPHYQMEPLPNILNPHDERQKPIIMDASGMSKTNALKAAIVAVILGGATYLAVRERGPHPLAIGDDAPNFSVPALPSGNLDLGRYRDQVVLVNFWATWCQPCVEEAPSLETFAEKMKTQGVVVLGVSVDDNQKDLEKFIADYHLSFPMGRDPDRALAARFGTFQFPETYILDRHGRLAEKVIGPTNWSDPRLESFVLELARGSGR
jgi:peroxiredoxin